MQFGLKSKKRYAWGESQDPAYAENRKHVKESLSVHSALVCMQENKA